MPPNGTMNIAPLTVSFTNTSSGDGLSYTWNFGDGETSLVADPNHTFSQGVWNVSLTVTNENGTDTTSTTIVALPPSNGGDGPPPGGPPPGGPPPGGPPPGGPPPPPQ